ESITLKFLLILQKYSFNLYLLTLLFFSYMDLDFLLFPYIDLTFWINFFLCTLILSSFDSIPVSYSCFTTLSINNKFTRFLFIIVLSTFNKSFESLFPT